MLNYQADASDTSLGNRGACGSLEWGTGEVNCLTKAVAISPLRVRRGFGTFSIKEFDYDPYE